LEPTARKKMVGVASNSSIFKKNTITLSHWHGSRGENKKGATSVKNIRFIRLKKRMLKKPQHFGGIWKIKISNTKNTR